MVVVFDVANVAVVADVALDHRKSFKIEKQAGEIYFPASLFLCLGIWLI